MNFHYSSTLVASDTLHGTPVSFSLPIDIHGRYSLICCHRALYLTHISFWKYKHVHSSICPFFRIRFVFCFWSKHLGFFFRLSIIRSHKRKWTVKKRNETDSPKSLSFHSFSTVAIISLMNCRALVFILNSTIKTQRIRLKTNWYPLVYCGP